MSASATATGSCSSSLPLELVPIFLVVAVTVAEAVEKLDSKLFTAVKRTLQGVPSAAPRTVLQWLLQLAVRVQLALRAANDPVAELLGRQIDGALEGRANGVPFKHWASPPLSSCWWPSGEAHKLSHFEKQHSAPPGQLASGFEVADSRVLEREHTENPIPIPLWAHKCRATDDRVSMSLVTSSVIRELMLCYLDIHEIVFAKQITNESCRGSSKVQKSRVAFKQNFRFQLILAKFSCAKKA